MSLKQKSLFLYGFQVTELNRSIDFRAVAAETPRQASLRLGYYSLTSLATEISRAMQEVDTSNRYTVTVDRTAGGGIQNRVTIATSGSYLQLLFSSGTRAASAVYPLIGFLGSDYTGALTYTGSSTAGTAFVTTYNGYSFLTPDMQSEVFGSVNISASGVKEAIVFSIQQYWQCEFKYITAAKLSSDWIPFMKWAIQQRLLEFTPDITAPTSFYEGTLEKTDHNGKGLGYKFTEMLPDFPDIYRTGTLTFRVRS